MAYQKMSASDFGFGCSGLMARLNLNQSVRLLEEAYEQGITYFDVARSYGYGSAEKAVGVFARGKRDHIIVATKLGILPPKKSTAMSIARTGARLLLKLRPSLRERLRARAGTMVEKGSFGIDQVRKSFETSLNELKMERVDVLLLHECQPDNLQDSALRELLQLWIGQGKVGRIGIAARHPTIEWALREQPKEDRVFQFASCLSQAFWTPLLEGRPVVTHSTLREGLPKIMECLRKSPEFARRWSKEIDLEPTADEVAALLLCWALHRYDRGKVLFSTSRGNAIGKNIQRALALAEQPQRLRALERLADLFVTGSAVPAT